MVHDLRLLVRAAAGRHPHPSAAIVASRTLRSTVESGARAGVDGHKQIRGSKVHAVVDTMGTLLALAVTPANEAERRQVDILAQQVQEVTAARVEVLDADAAYTGADAAALAHEQGIHLVVVTRPEASKGFVLLPKRSRGGTKLRLGKPLPPPRTRLRTTSHHADWSAFRCLRLSLAPQTAQLDRRFITPSNTTVTVVDRQC
jgi:transposase